MGQDSPSKRDNQFGYDGFALTESQLDHVAEKICYLLVC